MTTSKNTKKDKGSDSDSLKELERLLEKDSKNSSDSDEALIPKRDLIGVIIRLSVMITAALVLYFTGIFDNFVVVASAIVIFILIEAFNIMKMRKQALKDKQGSYLSIPSGKKKH